ncbi:MAG TPA: ABC transporter permease [Gemmatimonadaceae bacterium]|nr:ABC transporter permease [Gemmatimonadaceae bacterium]
MQPPRTRAERMFDLLLLAFPREFRSQFGAEMSAAFVEHRDAERAQGRAGVRFWVAVTVDLVTQGIRERASSLGSRGKRERVQLGTSREHRLDAMLGDVRLSARSLWRHPGFAATAVITLALGIGITTTMFGVVNTVLLRPLPYADPDHLVVLTERHAARGRVEDVAATTFRDWRERSRSFASLAAWRLEERALTGRDEPEDIDVLRVSASFFPTLGVAPAAGRPFTTDEEVPGQERVAILGHALWQRRFGGDPAILGRTITLNDASHVVLGIMPAGFRFADQEPSVLVPLAFERFELMSRAKRMFNVVGRLAPNVALRRAADEMRAIALETAAAHPATNDGWSVDLRPLSETVHEPARGLLPLFGAVGFVLLIACANAANLLLARGETRRRELAIRAALGASRGRLVRQLLLEALLIAMLGGAVGVAASALVIGALPQALPLDVPRWTEMRIDRWVLGFALAATSTAALLAGLAPALQLTAAHASGAARELSDRSTSSRGARRMRSVLVGAEVALAFVLLSGAALLIGSLREVTRVDPGFDPTGRLVAAIQLVEARYENDERQLSFFETLLDRIRAIPGVLGAGAVTTLPLSAGGIDHDLPFLVEGSPPPADGSEPMADFRAVSGGYFETMGIPVRSGRSIAAADGGSAPPVVVVNETLAGLHFANRSPIGERLRVGGSDGRSYEIVGVVADVHHRSLDTPARPELYVPLGQWPSYGSLKVVVRTASDPLGFAPALKQTVRAIDPQQPVGSIEALSALVVDSTNEYRFRSLVLGVFSALGILLAAVGIYGLTAHTVARRTREMGIRMAMGARAGDVARLVVEDGLAPVWVGLAAGAAAAVALTRVLSSFLFGLGPRDPMSFAATALSLVLVAALAAYLPARRATRIDPVVALRTE